MSEPLRSPWSSVDGVSPLPAQDTQGDDMARHYYDILGEQVLGEMAITRPAPVPPPVVGVDYAALVNAAAGIAKTGIDQKNASDAANKSKKDSEAAVQKSLGMDAEWANAEANLALASTDATAGAAARIMRDTAKSNALGAGAALTGDGIAKRCKASHDAMTNAASAASSAPKDIAKAAKFHGWKIVADACGSPPAEDVVDESGKHHKKEEVAADNWLTMKHAGLPTWGWGLIGVGGLTALTLIVRSMKSKK